MTKEELYKLYLDSYHEYPLLAELMAIRDERFKNEQQDYMLCVNGYIGIDSLNNYVKLKQEKQEWINLLEMFKNQQKEFISYLEEEINKWHYNYDSYNFEYEIDEPTAEELVNTIYQRYKEIIGVSNDSKK